MKPEQNQYQTILNVIGNVESHLYQFRGGMSVFEEWKNRALSSQKFGERIALLIEADQQMIEKKEKSKGEPKRKRWKFW